MGYWKGPFVDIYVYKTRLAPSTPGNANVANAIHNLRTSNLLFSPWTFQIKHITATHDEFKKADPEWLFETDHWEAGGRQAELWCGLPR